MVGGLILTFIVDVIYVFLVFEDEWGEGKEDGGAEKTIK